MDSILDLSVEGGVYVVAGGMFDLDDIRDDDEVCSDGEMVTMRLIGHAE